MRTCTLLLGVIVTLSVVGVSACSPPASSSASATAEVDSSVSADVKTSPTVVAVDAESDASQPRAHTPAAQLAQAEIGESGQDDNPARSNGSPPPLVAPSGGATARWIVVHNSVATVHDRGLSINLVSAFNSRDDIQLEILSAGAPISSLDTLRRRQYFINFRCQVENLPARTIKMDLDWNENISADRRSALLQLNYGDRYGQIVRECRAAGGEITEAAASMEMILFLAPGLSTVANLHSHNRTEAQTQQTAAAGAVTSLGRTDQLDLDVRVFRVAQNRRTQLDTSKPIDFLGIMRAGDGIEYEIESRVGAIRTRPFVYGGLRADCAQRTAVAHIKLLDTNDYSPSATIVRGTYDYLEAYRAAQRNCNEWGGISRITGVLRMMARADIANGNFELNFGNPE